ncbi:MAG: hypothetical protein MHMPM18_000868 [Marteilia pararefringens]
MDRPLQQTDHEARSFLSTLGDRVLQIQQRVQVCLSHNQKNPRRRPAIFNRATKILFKEIDI